MSVSETGQFLSKENFVHGDEWLDSVDDGTQVPPDGGGGSDTPVITSLDPSSAVAGDEVSLGIYGSGFTPSNGVSIDGDSTTYATAPINDTITSVFIPSGSFPDPVTVEIAVQRFDNFNTSAPFPFTFSANDGNPFITQMQPTQIESGPPDNVDVTLKGRNFLDGMAVVFNSSTVPTTIENTSTMWFSIPAGSVSDGPYDVFIYAAAAIGHPGLPNSNVVVLNIGEPPTADDSEAQEAGDGGGGGDPAPAIIQLDPAGGDATQQVTFSIEGVNLGGATEVNIMGMTDVPWIQASDTQIDVSVPANKFQSGTVITSIVVMTPAGNGTLPEGVVFTFS